ncbi:putative protein S-acyltransferase 7-like [Trifolium medium]|uniref:Uncharacterized protein n=1 Tax=Trifolium medium TaxID=97028 RepID=A0A392MFI1_9FABA|nr:putative protein S-acyltransferase 7-like [Trifolium medium]
MEGTWEDYLEMNQNMLGFGHNNQVLIALVLTSGRDPGIVPRNSYPPVPDEYDGSVSINNLLAALIVQYATTVWSDLIITAHGWASVLDW